jgi:predicted alpha/beta-hydrolase family hydrolase
MKALLLTPGSGGSTDHPTFHQMVEALDIPVVLYDFEYRRLGKRSPGGSADRLIPELAEAAAMTAEKLDIEQHELGLGGRSMGGRVCSMAVAAGLDAAGLALLSYPLHPPGKPDKLRVDHWPDIEIATLFVSGPSDPFGSPTEFGRHTNTVSGPVTEVWLDSGNHDPRNASQRSAIVDAVQQWLGSLTT